MTARQAKQDAKILQLAIRYYAKQVQLSKSERQRTYWVNKAYPALNKLNSIRELLAKNREGEITL